MIFKTEIEDFHLLESYKERNLYYKIFGGYLLNEIISGYEERKARFIQILKNVTCDHTRCIEITEDFNETLERISKEKWNVTFDYHTAQIFKEDKIEDRGEMSDVLILTKSTVISIECKFLSNYDIKKDIVCVQERIRKFSEKFGLAPLANSSA